MVQRYFLTLAYDGTNYCGWQRQPHSESVQEKLEWALSLILQRPVEVTGAGRTDTGVHARTMVAHFDVEPLEAEQADNLVYRLNRVLPKDISVRQLQAVGQDLHARFSATARTYRYYVHLRPNPFLRHYSLLLHVPTDFQLMNQAAAMLLSVDDFAAFAKVHTDVKTTLCNVTEAHWRQIDDSRWVFEITANRFLRNMVRAVVGTLLNVGRGKTTIEAFADIVAGKNRSMAGDSAPAHALFLEDIKY